MTHHGVASIRMKAIKSKVWACALALAGVSSTASIAPCANAQQVATQAARSPRTSVSGRVAIVERPGEATTDLGNTVIYLVPLDSASPSLPAVATSIAMSGRAFVPRLRVVTPGSRVAFPNQDPFSHNIFSTAPGAAFDLGLYPAGKSKDARFRRAGAFPVYCNIHPRMTAYIVVTPTPWFTQAGNDGRWTIDSLPPGRYTLHVWHERAKEVESEVTVGLSGINGVATQLDARGFRFAQHTNKFGKAYDKTGKDRY